MAVVATAFVAMVAVASGVVALAATRSVAADDAPVTQDAAEPATTEAVGNAAPPSPDAAAPAPELDPIVVDAGREQDAALVERTFDTPDDVAGFGETILAEPAWRGFESTGEMLGHGVGAQLRRQGGRDDFSTLSIRGAPSAQLRILLDGIALGRASDAVVNLSDLPLDTIERIEVYRGFAPVGLTPTSAAGVVNIVTRDPPGTAATAAAGGGSFGSAKANAGGAGSVLGGHAAAFAGYRHTEGDFDYVDDNGTLDNPADDRVRQRANNESDAIDSLLRWRRDTPGDTRVTLRDQVFWKDEGVPGLARFSPPRARLETTRNIAAAAIASRDARWSVEESVTTEDRRLTGYSLLDPDLTIDGNTTASTTVGRWSRPLGDSHWLSGSADLTWEGFEQSRRPSTLPKQEASRTSLAFGGGDDWTIAAIDTTLTVQLRHQELWNEGIGLLPDTTDRSTDPRVGLRWDGIAGLAVKSNFSTYFRPPTFDELYGTTGFTVGNPELVPETGKAWDAGFEWEGSGGDAGRLSLAYSWFGSDIDDVIVVWLTPQREAKARNVEKASIRGHEVRVEWTGPWGFALSGNYTRQDAENRSSSPALNGKDLAGIPPDDAWIRGSWGREGITLAYDLEVSGAHWADNENVQRIPTRTVHNVSVVLGPFWKGWRVTVEGDNLGNSLVPDQIGFPLPGRAFYATLSWAGSFAPGEDPDAS